MTAAEGEPDPDTSEVDRVSEKEAAAASRHPEDESEVSRTTRGEQQASNEKEKSPAASDSGEVDDEPDTGSNQERRGRSPRGTTADPEDPARPHSYRRSSSFAPNQCVVVPRAKRRGLLGRFAIIPEVESPYEYTNRTKWMITAIVALAAGAGPFGSGIFYPALSEMSSDLHASPTIVNLTVALYMLSMSIFPLWWSSFSETLGRRSIYVVSFTLFVVFSILSAVSVNISMLVIMRILAGGASASVQAVGAGTIADIWETAERGTAMGYFYLGPLCGPVFSPIIGGALSQAYGWRSTMWFVTIYGGVSMIFIVFGLPETLANKRKPLSSSLSMAGTADDQQQQLHRVVSTTQSVKLKTKQAAAMFKRFFIDPLRVLAYLRYYPVQVSVYSASVCFFSLFILNISIQSTFSAALYNFSGIIVGLLYLPLSLGYVVASLFGGRWIDYIMAREARRAERYDPTSGKLVYLPEDRMKENMWLAATLYPGALIWYGWTAQHGVHWVVLVVATFFFGCGSMLVFGAVTTMLTEFMPHRSSSGVAVNNFVRNIFSCVGAVVAEPLITALGNGWLCTMVGLFAWVTGNAAIWLLKRNGPRWRAAMDQALSEKK
ncbi:major facilitator superfamily domain-containing protein [Apodospora peruviana]|uniref:Major facilitator superfamily domain-containing protein n=1 Tax=Apodospora peruviana TaxID=516989 RepID=A0AAE0IJM7_9PEZI|nr:major facilitator superfamily domain-containing protein [Apodospora peruviana]